jgi:hypothetical protein
MDVSLENVVRVAVYVALQYIILAMLKLGTVLGNVLLFSMRGWLEKLMPHNVGEYSRNRRKSTRRTQY